MTTIGALDQLALNRFDDVALKFVVMTKVFLFQCLVYKQGEDRYEEKQQQQKSGQRVMMQTQTEKGMM